MPDILRDPIWQFVGAILVIIAIFISIILFYRQQRRKAVSYELVSSIPLLSVAEELTGKVKILFEGRDFQNHHLVIARIVNSGNVPILASDFVDPIHLTFQASTDLITVEVFETNPSSLKVPLRVEERDVILPPILLNARDSITLKILANNFSDDLAVNARIIGVRELQDVADIPRFWIESFIGGMGMLLVALTFIYMPIRAYFRADFHYSSLLYFVAVIVIGIGLGLFWLSCRVFSHVWTTPRKYNTRIKKNGRTRTTR